MKWTGFTSAAQELRERDEMLNGRGGEDLDDTRSSGIRLSEAQEDFGNVMGMCPNEAGIGLGSGGGSQGRKSASGGSK